jgi:hypothetical protein
MTEDSEILFYWNLAVFLFSFKIRLIDLVGAAKYERRYDNTLTEMRYIKYIRYFFSFQNSKKFGSEEHISLFTSRGGQNVDY